MGPVRERGQAQRWVAGGGSPGLQGATPCSGLARRGGHPTAAADVGAGPRSSALDTCASSTNGPCFFRGTNGPYWVCIRPCRGISGLLLFQTSVGPKNATPRACLASFDWRHIEYFV